MPAPSKPAEPWGNILAGVAEDCSTTPDRVQMIYDAIKADITSALSNYRDVVIPGFATMRVRKRKGRNGTNPRTHEHISYRSKLVVRLLLHPRTLHRLKTQGFT